MAGVGWGLAGVFSTPQLYIFSVYQVDVNVTINDTTESNISVIVEEERCKSLFKDVPMIHRQAYLTFIFVVNFFLPLIILGVCYIRIFFKIAEKVKEGKGCKKQSIKPGKVHLQSTQSSSLPKAKVKTLKMTIVIVLNFIICGTPYYVAEMIMNYGDWTAMLSPNVWGLLGALTTTNSVTNSYIFLLFNANAKCMRRICGRCPCVDEVPRHRDFDSSVSLTMNTEISRTTSKYSAYAPDLVEMAITPPGNSGHPGNDVLAKHNSNYTRMVNQTER
jgi:hypothetical protein